MKKVLLVLVCLMLVTGAILTGCAKPAPVPTPAPAPAPTPTPTPAPAPVEAIQLRLASALPPMHVQNKEVTEPWIQELQKRTQGRVKVTLFPGEALARASEVYELVTKGGCDIAFIIPAYEGDRWLLNKSPGDPWVVPYGAKDKTGKFFVNIMYEKWYQPLWPELKTLWIGMFTPNWLLSTSTPVRKLEDMKGRVIGISSAGIISDVLKAWGAAPESVTSPDMYLSLERKMIDVMYIPVEALLTFKLNEIIKYATNIQTGGVGPNFTVMTVEGFQKLPADVQKIMMDMRPWAETLQRERWDAAGTAAMANAKQKGIELIELPEAEFDRWLELRRPAVTEYLKALDARGVKGTELYNDLTKMMAEAGLKVK